MKKYKVKWALPAKLDLFEIVEFIAADNPDAAKKIAEKIRKQVSDLYISPERGRVVPELEKHGITQYRELIISPWRVIYQISVNIVYIVLAVDGRRNLEDILLRRIMR